MDPTATELFQIVIDVISYWRRHSINLKMKYHLDINKVIFNYSTNYVTMTDYDNTHHTIQLLENGTRIKYKSNFIQRSDGLDHNAVISEVGFKYGVNSFSAKLLKHDGFIWAIGFMLKPRGDNEFKLFNYKIDVNTGTHYYMNSFGYIGTTDGFGGWNSMKRVPRHQGDQENDPRIKAGDIILVTLDMDKQEIIYEINDKHIFTQTEIEPNETYHPCCWFLPTEMNQIYECKLNAKCCLH